MLRATPMERADELRAIEDNMAAGYALWGRHPRAMLKRDPQLTLVSGTVQHPMVNFVLGARFGPDPDLAIDQVVSTFARRRAPFMWYVGPLTTPRDLEARLLARGFRPSGSIVGMVLRNLRAPPPLPLGATIEKLSADDREGLAAANSIAAVGFRMPPEVQAYVAELESSPEDARVRVYLARLGGVPAATAVFAPTAGAGGLYNVATIPTARRRGLAGQLVLRALEDADGLALPIHVLQATQQAQHLYETMGFEARCEIKMLLKD